MTRQTTIDADIPGRDELLALARRWREQSEACTEADAAVRVIRRSSLLECAGDLTALIDESTTTKEIE